MTGVNASGGMSVALNASADRAAPDAIFVALNNNAAGAAAAPDWIQILPAGPVIKGIDGRVYKIDDMTRLARESLNAAGKLPIDENHATDLAAPEGFPSPARGWMVELQSRGADGLWARVDWSAAGKELLADRAYGGISPVLTVRKDRTVTRVLRASLVNNPNISGMAALNGANAMTAEEVFAKLKQMLGLADDAEWDDIWNSVSAVQSAAAAEKAQTAAAGAAQANLNSIRSAVGLDDKADAAKIVATVTELASVARATPDKAAVVELQGQLRDVTTQLNTLRDAGARERATTIVEGAIRDRRAGITPAMKDHYIARHMADPVNVEKEINAMPKLDASGTRPVPPKQQDGAVELNAEQLQVCKLTGVKPEDMKKTLAAEAAEQEEAA